MDREIRAEQVNLAARIFQPRAQTLGFSSNLHPNPNGNWLWRSASTHPELGAAQHTVHTPAKVLNCGENQARSQVVARDGKLA